jgi:hypothetical protein
MSARLAPIALFTYNRTEHTLKTLAALSQNIHARESDLFIFCDGAKHVEDEESVRRVRDVVKSQQWCGNVRVIERSTNWGLANSIISGVTELCSEFGKVIVLEDDLVTSPYFLEYMNRSLELYTEDPQVMQVSGHMFPLDDKVSTKAVFLPFTTSWGWATWDRAWQSFDPSAGHYASLDRNKQLQRKFNLNGSYPYFKMLENQMQGKINSWAIRWYLSVFMAEGLTVYPTKSLVSNIGFDGSGTHCGNSDILNFVHDGSIESFPTEIEIDNLFFESITSYLRLSTNHDRMRARIGRLATKLKQKAAVLMM